MELFRKKLKTRIVLFCAVLLLFVAILLYNQFGANDAVKDSLAFSFQCGFSAAGSLALVFWLMKYRGALKDEAKLRLLYNEEKDERMSAIRAKAGIPMGVIVSCLRHRRSPSAAPALSLTALGFVMSSVKRLKLKVFSQSRLPRYLA